MIAAHLLLPYVPRIGETLVVRVVNGDPISFTVRDVVHDVNPLDLTGDAVVTLFVDDVTGIRKSWIQRAFA